MDDAEASPSGRSKRQRPDKSGRSAALERFKQLKGSKHKYEVKELENVYDEVDEKVYSKTVMERQNDDWIVDDGGSGYVEDGREIFDDDLDDDSIRQAAKNTSLAGPRKKKKVEAKSKGNIKNMFMNMSSKKKPEGKLEDDDLLGNLMAQLQKAESTPSPKRNPSTFRNKVHITTKTQPVKPVEDESDSAKVLEAALDIDEPIFEAPKKVPTIVADEKKIASSPKKSPDKVLSSETMDLDGTDWESDGDMDTSVKPETPNLNVEISEQELDNLDFDDMDFTSNSKPVSSNAPSVPGKLAENLNSSAPPKVPSAPTKPPEKLNSGINSKNAIYDDAEVNFATQVWADDFDTQFTESEIEAPTNVQSIPQVKNAAGDKVFRFFWWDAFEDQYKQPGVVYLFGKVYDETSKSYISCCLQIKNIPRRLYLLPREEFEVPSLNDDGEPATPEMADVYKDFNEWATKRRITEFRSAQVKKKYAFDREGTPRECDYMEVRYPATFPAMEADYSSRAIEHVFGTSVTALELFLMERNVKGPCWLEVKNALPAGTPSSWCSLQVNCTKFENVSVYVPEERSPKLPMPPMIVATVNIRMALNSKHQQNEVVMIGVLLQNKYHIDKAPPKPMFQQHYCLVTRPRDTTWPLHARDILSKTKVIRCETEIDLLERFLEILHKADPDMLLGNDCGFQLDVLMHRISNLKIKNWSRVGKLRRSVIPIFKGKINLGQCFCGRPICDIQISAKELNLKVRSYDLPSLCMTILKKKENECKEVKPIDCPKFYNSAKEIEKLVQITMNEASYIITLMFELNVMPLAVQITCIAGNILSRTLSAGRAERNEYLLLHAFYQKGYITPDKRFAGKRKEDDVPANSKRKKAAYTGGLVLEPKKGFYDKLILLMDFNSLYPSIIQEYNLCFTTVPGAAFAEFKYLSIPEDGLEPGVVPTEIRKLVESRGEVKKLMNTPNLSPELKMQYNIRQMALKLTANSMYGCLGASHCRFYAKGLAALVTSKGREILENTKSLVEKLNFEVIYGDTDSIMVNTNNLDYEEALANAKKIKQEVNKLYKRVELDIDGVFRYLLLLQKKKYAARLMTKSPSGQIELVMEHKGLDIVRRDWCQIACDTGKNILDQLLSDQSSETRREKILEILQNTSTSIREGHAPLSSLVITKQLSKDPKLYPEKKLPHVSIALRLNKEGGRMWKAGDTIPYIICLDGTSRTPPERAYHVDEFKKSESLTIDVDYYILNQIFPVILRICEPIEGIDDVLLAKYLGLEGVYKSKRVIHDKEDIQVPQEINEERFKYCNPLKFKCRNRDCLQEIEISEFFTTFPSGKLPSLAQCPNTKCDVPPYKNVNAIQNELQLAIRSCISRYYADTMECEDPICSNTTTHVPMKIAGRYPLCRGCKEGYMHRVYSESQLYNQLNFYLHLFDLSKATSKTSQIYPPDMISAYDSLKEFVEKQLTLNAYSIVDLSSIFTESVSPEIESFVVEEGYEEEQVSDLETSFE